MKMHLIVVAMLGMALAVSAQTKSNVRTTDELTGLPLISATDVGQGIGNKPVSMPDSTICKSKMQGEFYSLYHITTDATSAWYAQNLKGFKTMKGVVDKRQQVGFYKPDGSVLVVITGEPSSPAAFSVAYERYSPGLSEKALTGLTTGKIDCR